MLLCLIPKWLSPCLRHHRRLIGVATHPFHSGNGEKSSKSSYSCQEPGEQSEGILRDHGQHQRKLPPDNLRIHGQNLRKLPHDILMTMVHTKGS